MMRTSGIWTRGMFVLAAVVLAAGCSTSGGKAQEADRGPDDGPMSMAEMRLDAAGGSSQAPASKGLVAPVANPADATPGANALTDAGANTPLGKQWIFVSIAGYDGGLPPAPTQAAMLLSRGNGRMIGNTSCNAMGAAFEINIGAGTLSFRNLTNGNALCSRQASDTEDAVVNALMATDGFRLLEKRLALLSKGKVVAELTTP